tara:strand:+ start:8934 stop:11216 length:2283 start_codon:yes stop_codon:yes gene_type:complete
MNHPRSKYLPTIALTAVLFLVPTLAFAGGITNILFNLVAGLFGRMVGWAGYMLNVVVDEMIIGFGNLYITGVGQQIDLIWVSIRDIFNITFIFGLVYIGFKMILDSTNSSTRQWLIYLIMAAVFVNFSLLISKTVVDVSNVVASEIALSAFPASNNSYASTTVTGTQGTRVAISDTFMDHMGITATFNILGPENRDGAVQKMLDEGGLTYVFGLMIIFLVATFVFAAGAILLITRFVALLLYMVFSPLMFIGWVFPQFRQYSSRYWRGFLGKAFFAPIYLLLLYVSSKILGSFTTYTTINVGTPNYAASLGSNAVAASNSVLSTLIPFIIGCILLISSLTVAKHLGVQGASSAISMGNRMRRTGQRWAGGAMIGGSAAVLRNTAGRAANAYASSDTAKRRAANSFWGRKAFQATSGIAGASFDARNVAGVGNATGLGTGKKGGYKKAEKDRVEAEKKFAKSIHLNRDKDDPEYIAEKKKNEEDIKRRAVKDAAVARDAKTFTGQSFVKRTEDLEADLKAAKKELEQLNKANKQAQKSKDLTAGQKEDAEYAAKGKQAQVEAMQRVYNLKLKEDEIKRNRTSGTISDEQAGEQLAAVDREFDAINTALENRATGFDKLAENTKAAADAATKYAAELEYINDLQNRSTLWNSPKTASASAVGVGMGAGAMMAGTGLLFGGAAAVGGVAAVTHGARGQAAVDALKREYGDNGTKMAGKEKRQKKYQEQDEARANDGHSSQTNNNQGGDSSAGGENNDTNNNQP